MWEGFLGQPVCTRAFIDLTGISAGSLQNARELSLKGVVASLELKYVPRVEGLPGPDARLLLVCLHHMSGDCPQCL